ncbi:NACHT domain-containing protein [Streptomyces sp. NPDC088745]|uniref:NACHT domain-containing protein n=1 Tax=Streptomyces sp. NPDC088745 TaxID=3365884 RepID=UPI00382CE562
MGMRGRRLLSYRDAVAILGGDSEALAAADRAVSGALSTATGGASDAVLGLFGAQGRVLRTGRDVTQGLRDRLGSAERAERTEQIAAAHAVLVITAFFEVLAEAELPFEFGELELNRNEQLALAGGQVTADHLVGRLLSAEVPHPTAELPFEGTVVQLRGWYSMRANLLRDFLQGLALWERLDEDGRTRTRAVLLGLEQNALVRYRELYAQLALEIPEFGFWSGQIEHQATRSVLRQSLDGVERALLGLTRPVEFAHAAHGLTASYRAALPRPILSEGEAPSGLTVPSLAGGYVDPDFRVAPVPEEGSGPAQEEWWERVPVRSDLTEFLSGTLTSLASTTAPLLVLGQPGAGKSVLTKILAARLSGTGFLPVRIVLREIRAEDDVQDQIEHAVRSLTHERVSWPELVRSAPGAVPVLLFDGFDELLQATGVNQTDYLVKIAKFQQQEADQGRPVYALVTSRTAVADRARCPQGTLALRLEPFRELHIRRWLDVWNGLNAPYFTAQGLRPLPAAVAARHPALASQPLLLLMLALYDATANALQQETADGEPLAAADLYEELLTSFAVREVGKSGGTMTSRERADHCERELQRLGLIAFGILNRRRQWITVSELEADLTALLGRPAIAPASDFRTPLNQAEIALGRFFFVQKAQAVQDERELTTYEFLHATFGEYLVARLAVLLVDQLLDQRPALSLGRAPVDDDLVYVLLSYASLASRQMLRFVEARIARLDPERRERLGELLIGVMEDARNRVEHRYADYRPIPRATAARHGKYEANLMMLTVLLTGGVTARRLFPEAVDPAGIWPLRVQLYRSALTAQEWTEYALALDVKRSWVGDRRELTVYPLRTEPPEPDPVDPYWVYGYPPSSDTQTRASYWARQGWVEARHKMVVADVSHDEILRHALDPFFRRFGAALDTFHGPPGAPATSWAHDLLEVWLTSHLGTSDAELTARYERCVPLLDAARGSQFDYARLRPLLLGQALHDAPRLPLDRVSQMVRSWAHMEPETVALQARVAIRALDACPRGGGEPSGDMPMPARVLRAHLLEMLAELAEHNPGVFLSVGEAERGSPAAREALAAQEHRLAPWAREELRQLHGRPGPGPDA